MSPKEQIGSFGDTDPTRWSDQGISLKSLRFKTSVRPLQTSTSQ